MRSTLVVWFAIAWSATASANVGRRTLPGTRSAEPAGIETIAIDREELTFDLRPLAEGDLARITARYHLVNAAAATVTAPLVFISGMHRLDDFRVTVDGEPVTADGLPGALSDAELAALPASWSAPRTTPPLDGGDPLPYEIERTTSHAFTIAIAPGRHELAVSYRAFPQKNRSPAGGTLVWQLGYVLAPARDWGRFGGLDVTVEVPPGWRAAVTPELARTGDTLRGRFDALPADTLGITVQAPSGTLHAVLQIVTPLVLAVVVLGGIAVLFVVGRRRGRGIGKVWPTALAVALGWAVAIGVAGHLAAMRTDLALPAHQSAHHGYGQAFGILLAYVGALLAVPIGIAIAIAGSRRG